MVKTNKKSTQRKQGKSVEPKSNPVNAFFPSKLVEPVKAFLKQQLGKLETQKTQISKEDPFKNSARMSNNASPDTDAEEQFGHARTSAIKEQIDRRIIQTKKALAMIRFGKYGVCEDCGRMIDTDRLMIYPDATICAEDQTKREK